MTQETSKYAWRMQASFACVIFFGQKFLEDKFGMVPGKLIDQIHTLNRQDVLENLFRQAMRCSDLDSFKQLLSKAKE